MKNHADSQIGDAEAARLLVAALESPEHRGSRRLVHGAAIDAKSMLTRWVTDTPEGPLHEIIELGVVDGEVTQSWAYRNETETLTVWEHLAAEIAAGREVRETSTP